MAEVLEISNRDLKLLAKLFKRAPLKMGAAGARVLNSMAFSLKNINFRVLEKELTIRSPGFVKSRLRVSMARTGPINTLEAEAGSITGDRFTGWKEQQYGTPVERKRTHTRYARGGSWQGKVRQGLRSRQKNPMYRMSDFNIKNAKNKKHRLIIFLQILDKKKISDRFDFPGYLGRMNSAVYQMKNGKIRGVYRGPSYKIQPQRIPWMDKSIDILLREYNPTDVWRQAVKYVFRLK